MDRIAHWKLADELTVYQIALLIAGYDPSEFEGEQPDRWPDSVRRDVSPFLNAIKNSARSKRLEFSPVYYETSFNGPSEVDWTNSTINIESLCEWLHLRNFQDGYFISSNDQVDKLANPAGEFYAPKLAAVRGWNEVTADPEALNGKTPKKALEVWLRKHANEYGLTNKDGNPNELGIEEICKVANWKPSGGASPTPAPENQPSHPLPVKGRKVRPRPPTPPNEKAKWGRNADLDPDIPF